MAIDIQTKDGQRSTTYITDSCFGIVYDIRRDAIREEGRELPALK